MGSIRGGMIEALLAALGVAGFVIGVMLIYLGRRGRRIDEHPLCAKCGYDLTGRPEASTCCAECGADLSRRRATRVGNRVPRRRVFWVGVSIICMFLMLTGGIVWVQMSSADLMKHKPVWLLRSDASSLLSNKRVPAVNELTRRFTAGELSDAQLQAIISDALVFQADPNFPWKEWDGLVSTMLPAGKIGDTDWITFVKQAVRLKLIARPRIRAGDPMPVTLTIEAERLAWQTPQGSSMRRTPFVEFEWLDAQISGVKLPLIVNRSVKYPTMLYRESLEGLVVDEAATATLAPGIHTLSGHVLVHVLNVKSQRRISSLNIAVDKKVTLLPGTTETRELFVTDPATNIGMQNAAWDVRVTAPALGAASDLVVLQITVRAPPAGLAHQAYLRTADGNEFAMGTINFTNATDGWATHLTNAKLGPAATVDVILRPDFELVKSSTRDDPIWGEEVIFRDIKVGRGTAIPGGGQRPSTAPRLRE